MACACLIFASALFAVLSENLTEGMLRVIVKTTVSVPTGMCNALPIALDLHVGRDALLKLTVLGGPFLCTGETNRNSTCHRSFLSQC